MIQIVPFEQKYRGPWDEYVLAQPSASIAHQIGWREVIAKGLGHKPHYFLALEDGRVRGVLPLFLVQTWWRARYLISIPWLDYGGVCADDPATASAILQEAARLAGALNCRFVEHRSTSSVSPELPTTQNRVTFVLNLTKDPEELWKLFDAKLRNQIRKSQKSELTTELGGTENLPEFYRVFCRNMRDLGTPVWGRSLFEETLKQFPGSAQIILVKKSGEAIAGGLVLSFKGRLYVPSASAKREFLPLCPNHALYWSVIEDGCRSGQTWFDFGRSAVDSNTFKFKKQWVPEPTQLYWQYQLNSVDSIPEINPRNPKYRFFINTWQRLPLSIANFLGPRVIRNFP